MPELTDVIPLYGSSTGFTGEVAHLLEDDEVDALIAKRDGDDDDDEEDDDQ